MTEWLAVVLIACALSVSVFIQLRNKKLMRLKREQTLRNLSQLHKMIGLLQKHRGQTASFLQAGKKDDTVLKDLRRQIAPLCEQLTSVSDIAGHDHWLAFMDHWRRLQNNVPNMTVAQSFNQHTSLISNMLLLLEDSAEGNGLTQWELPEVPCISLLWREFPVAVEYIGQARAVGMAVTSAGVCDQVNRVRLGYLQKRIVDLADNVFHQFELQEGSAINLKNHIAEARVQCELLYTTIEQELLKAGPITLAPDHYFTIASCAMDCANSVMKLEFQYIEAALQSRQAA